MERACRCPWHDKIEASRDYESCKIINIPARRCTICGNVTIDLRNGVIADLAARSHTSTSFVIIDFSKIDQAALLADTEFSDLI